ncbi:MAG: radical SAM protein [Anaerolineales bacterium]|jgi:wyosine [tRNA(Phe)-imidazoG37] synthetase (radical SAM superfamily)|nr:radical SAM protein [Anaerolineales bacterium]
MKYVFGPVPSRRLGKSLGIDPLPLKTCNWNCVYCQLGRSTPLINQRREYFPREDIAKEVDQALKSHAPGDIDWVTFVGSGETTLHTSLGWLIRQVKSLTHLPVAVITNGSLLYQPEVRRELSAADAVLPSLDAGDAGLYRKINRPHPEVSFKRLTEGMSAFRKEYQGKLWVEVMLVRGFNDTEDALVDLAAKLEDIQPDEVHLLQPDRPPAEPWVQPADEEGLLRARAILGEVAHLIHPASGSFDLSGAESLVEAVIGIITRHPMREAELIEALKHQEPLDIRATLAQLEMSGKAQVVERYGTRFWSAAPAYYPGRKPI